MTENCGKVQIDRSRYQAEPVFGEAVPDKMMLEDIKHYGKDSLQEVIKERKSYNYLFYLSEPRKNIIEWYPFSGQAEVLAVGADTGMLTDALAQKAAHVTCVETSETRAKMNAAWNAEKDNVRIILGNYPEVEDKLGSYDYITLIGEWKYARSYYENSEDAYRTFLLELLKHLKTGGELLLATENKMGMKYWAGCQDDYYGGYYRGIEDYPGEDNVRTFSKKELEEELGGIEGISWKFYYPYPDYKFPMAIYSDEYLPKTDELTMNIRNFDRDRYVMFDEEKAFGTVIKEGLFSEFSNSFMVTIKKEQ